MKIELLDQQTIKVILTSDDMQEFDITYEEMDYNDPVTRRPIVAMLYRIKEQTCVDLTKGKLFIEAFPVEPDGCILYINMCKQVSNKTSQCNIPLVFSFSSIEEVFRVCETLFQYYSHLIFKSSLYRMGNIYFLSVYSFCKLEEKLTAIISEYGILQGKGSLYTASLQEYSQCIIPTTAIETLAYPKN